MGDERDLKPDNLRFLPKRDGESKFEIVDRASCFCTFVVSEKKRTVTCRLCGRLWDPIEAFLHVIRDWTNYDSSRQMLKADVERLEAKKLELKSEIANLRAQRRRME